MAKPILHYMGCSTFSNHTVLPEIALAKIQSGRALRQGLLHRLRRDHRHRRGDQHRQGRDRLRAIVFGLGGIGLNVIQGLRLAGADQIVGVDLNPDKKVMAERFGMTDFVNPSEVEGDLVPYLVDLTKGGADYTFDAPATSGDARGAGMRAQGLGRVDHHRRGTGGAEISTRPFQLVTGRSWRGTAFGGARGRTDVPKIVDWYMDGKIEIDPMITHTMPLEDINKGFDLMHAGESIRSVEDAVGEALGTYYIRPNAGGGGAHVCNCGYITGDAARGSGVARAMLAHSLEEARRQGYRAMQFNFVVTTNDRAVDTWQRAGFRTIGRLARRFPASRPWLRGCAGDVEGPRR
jgi:GNAT superfamily N-acetyltransferase